MFNPKRSARFDHLSLLSPRVGLAKKNRSRHSWSILLSKLSNALFYTLFGVNGDRQRSCLWDNLRAGHSAHIFKTASEKWRPALSAWFFTMDTTGKLGRGDKRLLSYSVRLLKTTFRHWLEDKAPQLGAALAYYTVFSLAPMVLVLLAVFGLIYGNSEIARREILHQLYSFLDRSSAKAVEDIAASAGKPTASAVATVVVSRSRSSAPAEYSGSCRMRSTPSGASNQSPAGVSSVSCARGFYPSPWSPACAFCF